MMTSLSILITGDTGWTGGQLSRLALKRKARVYGFARRKTNIEGVVGRLGDITRYEEIEGWLAECRPDWIFHLAGLVHGSGDFDPVEMLRVNVEGTRHLLEAVRKGAPAARVLVAGSSAVYGQPRDSGQPIGENSPLCPLSDYALSKAAQDKMAAQYFREHGLQVLRGRTFNQTGPGEPAGLVCAMLARQVARITAGLQQPLVRVQTLQPCRDFCDVRDVIEGYWAVLEYGAAGEAYNICSGRSHSIRQVMEILLSHARIKDVEIEESGLQPAPPAISSQVGDHSRLTACSGWEPRTSLEESLRDLLEEWRFKVRGEM